MKRSLNLVFLLARNKVAAPMQDSQTGGIKQKMHEMQLLSLQFLQHLYCMNNIKVKHIHEMFLLLQTTELEVCT